MTKKGEKAMQLNVIICCRIYLYAEGLWGLLKDDEELKVLGVACNDQDIQNLMQFEPDVVIADLFCCRKILKKYPSADDKKILLINDSIDLSGESLKEMIAGGLGGILPKDADGRLLQKAVHKLNEGELWIDHQTMREVFRSSSEPARDIHLTKKEMEVLGYVCSGMTNKEIARKLFISEQTVKSHCNHLFKKFGVSSRLKLALCAPKYMPETINRMQ